MGAGRKTQTFTKAPTPDLASYSVQARSLSKNHLGGVIFGCKSGTMMECLSKQLFGLPGPHFIYVKNISPGLPLFLFNYDDRTLHGIYEAASHGQMNIDPYGWTTDGSVRTQFPAQAQIRVRLQCQPLRESQFKPIIVDNYYSANKFWFELDHAQANKLMTLLASCAIAPGTSMPQKIYKRKTDLPLQSSRKTTVEAQWLKPLASGATTLVGNHISDVKESEQEEQHLICTKLKELSLQRDLNSQCQNVPLSINFNDTAIVNATPVAVNWNPPEPARLDLGEMKVEKSHSWSEKSGGSTCSLSALSPRSLSDQSRIDKLVQEVEELKAFKNEQTRKMGYLEHKLEQAKFEIKQLKDARKLECESTPSLAHIDEKQVQSEVLSESESILTTQEKDTASCDMLDLDPNESIYIVGGHDGESWLLSLDSYYPSQDVIKSLGPMSSVRAYASVAKLDGDLYVIGGGDSTVWYNTVESYCPAEDQWKICPSLREKKGSLAAATANNKIFAMGGGNGLGCFSDVEMLDIDVGRWIRTQSMLQKRFSLAAAELNGVLYATGGYDGNGYLKSVDRFDPREHSWKTAPCMNSKRGCHSLVGLNGKLYALGGYDGESMVSSVEIFDPRLESWMPGEPMNYTRGYSAAAVVNDAIYVIGGVQESATIAETVECYREGQGWQEMNGVTSKRCFLSASAYMS
nr:PREDICTED: kelch-like protein 12 isoform X3 [Fragaria vesca subsp. vesca]XP_011466442.1 PREDICTED: kelch-like protein 12 isoform X3 [Fragaria vesca subsp. vesca]